MKGVVRTLMAHQPTGGVPQLAIDGLGQPVLSAVTAGADFFEENAQIIPLVGAHPFSLHAVEIG